MPMKEQQRMVYRTAKGIEIDLGKLINQNELVPAVGNAKVNARGDKLGEGGKIIKRREEMTPQPVTIPNQINVRAAPAALSKKDIGNQDPEGNE
jgi:hypothetical protein